MLLTFAGSVSLPLHAEYLMAENIAYYGAAQNAYQESQCRLDLYYPSDIAAFPTVVWFHPGGLTSGERFVPQELMDQGIAVVAVSYRLSPHVTAPAYIEDAARSVAWTFQHIEDFGGSRQKIYVAGHSAGGYLAAMVGLDPHWLLDHDVAASELAGIVPFSGQMITHFTIRAERGLPGKVPVIDDYAPMRFVRKHTPPILLFTGDRNLEIMSRYEENAYMWRLLKTTGNEQVELVELSGYDHVDMSQGAFPLLMKFIRKIEAQRAE